MARQLIVAARHSRIVASRVRMHEFGITESIINIVLDKAKEAEANRVTRISLVAGQLSGFVPDCIQFYFEFLSKGSPAEGATLHFESPPAQIRCRDCSTVFHPQDTVWTCPSCQSESVEIEGGRELYVKSIEVE
ncbi:MAG: hydrogenase maturation nickel metallochaperone HypA [Dehalococcoidia bacterium]|nr:hydrogenase maturation nickel metallochaperone HypA [Dehalococcoidia bacterium]